MSDSYFSPNSEWVVKSDYHESDTHRSLKELIAELKAREQSGLELSNDICDSVELLLYKYEVFVKQGVRERFAKHSGVSWYLTDSPIDARAFISYQDGPRAEWAHDCYADEVPLWLLIGLFHRIKRRKPLGDQKADETIAAVDDLDAEYVQKASTLPHYASYVEDHDDE
jgi:hypothetical protein